MVTEADVIGTDGMPRSLIWENRSEPVMSVQVDVSVGFPDMRLYRQVPMQVERALEGFDEIKTVYRRNTNDGIEYFVVAEFTQEERENAFYVKEAELLSAAPLGTLAILLINLSTYQNPPVFTPPPGAKPIQRSTL